MGRGLWQVGKGGFSLWSDFDKQLVVADDTKEGAIAEQAVFPRTFCGRGRFRRRAAVPLHTLHNQDGMP